MWTEAVGEWFVKPAAIGQLYFCLEFLRQKNVQMTCIELLLHALGGY